MSVAKRPKYSVYVIRLSSEAGQQPRFIKRNPDRRPDKPCVYVGSTSMTPEERYTKHVESMSGSLWVKRYGAGLHKRLTDGQPKCLTRAEAEVAEYSLALRLRARGYGVWTNLPSVPGFCRSTRFRAESTVKWPRKFAIITAYATTGEAWTSRQNKRADLRLGRLLSGEGGLQGRIEGFSPESGHSEPGWVASVDFQRACDMGKQFKQDAIYWVEGGRLYLSYCDGRRGLIPLGVAFRDRLDAG